MGLFSKLVEFVPSPRPTRSEPFHKEDFLGETGIHRAEHSLENEAYGGITAGAFGLGEHWTIAGATGTGKTIFSRELLEQYRRKYPNARRYVLNSTADIQLSDCVGGKEYDTPYGSPSLDPAFTSIWTPPNDNQREYDKWLLGILYRREPAIVLLDDIASLVGYGRTISILDGHMRIMKQGRKHGITVINGTQEMTRVPLVMFRQMTHFIQLRLSNDPMDMAYARRYLGIMKEEQRPPHGDYGFFYKRIGIKFPVAEYDSYRSFFHKGKY